MKALPALTRSRITRLCIAAMLCLSFLVGAEEVTWTGAVDSAWFTAGNWDDGPPGPDDIAIVPVAANPPEIGVGDPVCSGLILEEDATVRVLDSGLPTHPYGLYIIGPGDLDGDGVSDIAEYDEGYAVGVPIDVDTDGVPNFADTDSDDDGIPDACEFTYGPGENNRLHPYFTAVVDQDYDGDDFTDVEECEAGTDPTDPDDKPVPVPLIGLLGLAAFCLMLIASASWALRRTGPRTRRMLFLLLLAALLPLGIYGGVRAVFAGTLSVDFALGQTIEQIAAVAMPGDTLEIDGASLRPWNGQSTYVNSPVTLQADGGPVFLGGIPATLETVVIGYGSVEVQSAYTGSDHFSAILEMLLAGSLERQVFLGERFTFTPEAEPDWGFHGWMGDASGTDDPMDFQILVDGSRVTAVFGPPGPDLAASVDTGPPAEAQAGDGFNVVIGVENIGQETTTQSPWIDRLYLSRDAVFDDADLELATGQQRSSEVAAGASYTASFSVTLPDVAPGHYFVLGVADRDVDVDLDIYRDNNVAAVGMIVFDANLAQ